MLNLLAAESSNDLIKVVPGLMIWTLIAFGITFFVLKKFAFGPIQKTIDARRDRIREAVDEADNARGEAHDLLDGAATHARLALGRLELGKAALRGEQHPLAGLGQVGAPAVAGDEREGEPPLGLAQAVRERGGRDAEAIRSLCEGWRRGHGLEHQQMAQVECRHLLEFHSTIHCKS